jgi:NADH-quinone oxidoreductase subunit J
MNLEVILFTLFAILALISAILMITRKNAVLSAVYLILNFFALAGLYLLLNAQFIAVVQIIVYAGAIMVLFLFVLMLLNQRSEESLLKDKKALKIFSVLISAVVLFQIVYIIFFSKPSAALSSELQKSIQSGTIEQIGKELYTNYILPFEAAGFLLLAAAIGALVLAKKKFEQQ